ncbi:MAG TPA: NUDIX domain-containing protein [Ureibacillus sp.]|nr:NUDIX domain-containing protein [Ureibacillus sp.]
MELWDVYDMNRNKTDRTWVRGEPLQPGDYHVVVHVCIFNSKGEMLIQQRQPFKQGWSNYWDITVGGSAVAGDSSQDAAQRELEEEIGLKLDLQHVRPHITLHFERGFDDIYLIEKDVDIHTLKLQYEEVQDVRWASKEEILEMIKTGEFIPYFESIIEFLFDVRKQRGSVRR